MQTAHLKRPDIHFAYVDSGNPATDDYTTLVCLHGNTYHAQSFQRLLPLAAKHNIRLIALNRRDYIGSTPFDESELDVLRSTDALKHRQFLFNIGLEIAHFLLWVINELGIPPARDDFRVGGISLLGWSLGNITSFAFLANFPEYPKEVTRVLEHYIRHYFVYEAVYQFLGLPSPEGAYHPLWDDEIPFENKSAIIDDWFTTYFDHPCFAPDARVHNLSTLQLRIPPNPDKPPTSHNRTPEEFAAITDTSPVMRSEIAFYFTVRQATLYEQYKAAFTSEKNNSGSLGKPPLPRLKVTILDGTHTVWNIIWTAWEVKRDVERWKREGLHVRPVSFITMQGSNHHALWDEPEHLMDMLAACLA